MESVTPSSSTCTPAISSQSATGESDCTSKSGQVSLLAHLKCPKRSELSRKRQIEKPKLTCSGSSKKHKPGAANLTDPKSVSPTARVKEFPGECLCIKSGKLFCTACREELALKKGTIKNHIQSGDKHKKAKEKLLHKEARERDISESLKSYDKEVKPSGTRIPMEERVFRVRVVEQFLQAGIPLAKIDKLRGLLEEGVLRLSHSSHLADYIPFILQSEKQAIRKELEGKEVSVVFDGTSRLGEALAIVVRYCCGWKIKQKLVRLSMLAKTLCGEEVARELLAVLSTELGIPSSHLLAVMRDRASVNNVAVRTLTIMYPFAIDIGCFSHTLSHVGEHFKVPSLDKFMKHWEQIFVHSHKCRLIWCEQTGRSVVTYSHTRWWSKWECEKQVLELFGDIPEFLHAISSAGLVPKTCDKILQHLLTKSDELMIELAVIVDIGESFVTATYELEGDGPLAFECYETLSRVRAAIQVCHLPNTAAISKRIASPTKSEDY